MKSNNSEKMGRIEDIILNNETLMGIRKDMNKIGYDFQHNKKGLEEAYEEARGYWNLIRESEFPLESISQKMPKKMPTTDVSFNSKKYHITGIVHGVKGENFRDYYHDQIKKLVENGEKIIAEQNFTWCYAEGLDGIEELKDHLLVNKETEPLLKKQTGTWHSIKEEDIDEMYEDGSEFSRKLADILKYPEVDEILIRKMGELLKETDFSEFYESSEGNLEGQISFFSNITEFFNMNTSPKSNEAENILKIRELSKRTNLPQPLEIGYNALNLNLKPGEMGFIEELKKSGLKHTLRSIYMAWEMMEKSKEADEVYILVGEGHEAEIEYFLKVGLERRKILPKDLTYYKYETNEGFLP